MGHAIVRVESTKFARKEEKRERFLTFALVSRRKKKTFPFVVEVAVLHSLNDPTSAVELLLYTNFREKIQ